MRCLFLVNIYIKELEKEEFFEFYKSHKWIKNITWKLIKSLNLILKKEIEDNKKIYLIPNINKEKIYIKIKKKLEKEKTQTQKIQIILSKNIKKYQEKLKEYKIVDGKQTFIKKVENILEKILQENAIQMQDVYILANKYSEQSMYLIRNLAPKVKTMNIITKEIEKYRTLEEIMQENGIAISISNNKKKSLKKAKIIINLDFEKEEIIKYTIFRNAILINLTQEKITNLKGFDGIIVQDIEVNLEEAEWIKQNRMLEEFRQLEVYESIENLNTNIQVIKLYGNNGPIDEKELRNWQKILTN